MKGVVTRLLFWILDELFIHKLFFNLCYNESNHLIKFFMIKKRKSPIKVKPEKMINEAPKVAGSRTAFFVLIIIVVAVTAGALMIGNKVEQRNSQMADDAGRGTAVQQDQKQAGKPMEKSDITALISRVSQLITVKPGEDPTVATVQDSEMLKASNPVFYKDVENGDRLLVWSDKAVLYSVKQDRLLSVMPIVGEQPTDESATGTSAVNVADNPTSTEGVVENVSLEIRNGTKIAGLARSASETLKSKDYSVYGIGDAVGKNYAKTLIIKTSDNPSSATIASLQSLLQAEVLELPAGEVAGKADLLIIIGANYQ